MDRTFHWRKFRYALWTHISARHEKKDMLKCLNDGFVSYKHAAFHFTICLLLDWSHANQLWIIVSFYQQFGLSF